MSAFGLFHKADLRKSELSQATIADYGAEGDTGLDIVFQGGRIGTLI